MERLGRQMKELFAGLTLKQKEDKEEVLRGWFKVVSMVEEWLREP